MARASIEEILPARMQNRCRQPAGPDRAGIDIDAVEKQLRRVDRRVSMNDDKAAILG